MPSSLAKRTSASGFSSTWSVPFHQQFLSLVLLLYTAPFLGFIYQPQQLGKDKHARPPSQHGVTVGGSWKTILGTLVDPCVQNLYSYVLHLNLVPNGMKEFRAVSGTRSTLFRPGSCLDLHQDPIYDRSRGIIRVSYTVHSVFSQGHCQKGYFAGSHLRESK